MDKYQKEIDIDQYDKWADESLQIVQEFVYEQILEHKEVPEEYIKKGQDIAHKQLTIAGYRLAKLLTYIWNQNGARQDLTNESGTGFLQE